MRIRLCLVLIVLVAATPTLVAPTGSATAQPSGGAGYDDGYVFAGYEDHPVRVTRVDTTRPRTPSRWCVHWPLSLAAVVGNISSRTPEEVRQLSIAYRGPLVDGGYYQIICYRTGESAPYRIAIIEYRRRDPTAGEITTIEDVAEYARQLVTAPEPVIATSPPADRLVVGFETWLATPEPFDAPSRSAQAGHFWATAVPVPTAITYDLGDGTRLRCAGPPPVGAPGVLPDDRPDCARHTYLDSQRETGEGTFTVRATVTYDVWLTTSEDSTPRLADTVDGPTVALDVTVREIQAVIR
jgi:hypothetical protein